LKSTSLARLRATPRAARFLSGLLLSWLASAPSPAFAADQVVDDCSNDTELRADLAVMQETSGGTLTFSCATSTIVLTADLPVISTDTFVEGDGKITISGADARRIFVVGPAGGLSLTKLALINGASTGDGGAILSEHSLLLQDVVIRNSVAGGRGGAISTTGGLVIEDSELNSNEAANGGAISVQDAGLVVKRTRIHDNAAIGSSDGKGGGVYMSDDSAMNMEDSVISANSADNCGGGIFSTSIDSAFVVERTRVVDNSCKGGDGAGIHSEGSTFVIEESEISSNETPGDGGGVWVANADAAVIETSTLASNSSGGTGGAMMAANTTMVLQNLTISSNHALSAGGMRIENDTAVLDHVTIASNEGGGDGAFDYFADGDFDLVLARVLLADNQEPNLALAGSSGATIASTGGNVSDDDSGAAVLTLVNDVRSAQTLLGPLRLNGGLTPTHVPQPGSDAVDTGVALSGTDQRGIARPQGPSLDAGAVEVVPCGDITAICGDANENGSITSSDSLKALRTSVDADECALWFCDYDGNGTVSAPDALAILREAVGQQPTPKCPPVWDCHSL
jgi:predicted outer membrane repeat protein